jgi:hypothetical protein
MFYLRSIWSVGSKHLDSLSDYSYHHYRLRADCLRCKRVSVLDPLPLIQRCQAKGWSYQIGAVAARLVCAECGSREVRWGQAFGEQYTGGALS